TNFVLANYKTDQCTKPPRLCRQGYACPHYHNSRDRRRNPRKSTPCPNVKHGDEWGEPSKCDSGDSCQYCHSRTEQQFHPEVSCSSNSTVTPSSGSDSLLSPVGSISRPIPLTNTSLCSESATSRVSPLTSNYPKAPGFEREDQVHRIALFRSRKDKTLPIFTTGIYFALFYFPYHFNLITYAISSRLL
ncbi:hypothetical protein XENOCAPTIV_027965, partial [Xenoophorus captivus]